MRRRELIALIGGLGWWPQAACAQQPRVSVIGFRTKQLAALVLRYGVAAIYQCPEFAATGGLMSYGGSITDSYYLAGVYAGRLVVPPAILARADEVIE